MTLFLIFFVFPILDEANAQEWTRFRGPNGTGLAKDIQLPIQWRDSDYAWKVKLKGTGTSSPVTWGDKIFVTSCDNETAQLFVQCLSVETGEEIWMRTFDSIQHRKHGLNSFASSTPAVDEARLYVAMANPEHTILMALDHSGADVWRRDFGSWTSAHGFGISPMIYKDKVILVNSQQKDQLRRGAKPGKSRVIALNKEDGSNQWTTPLTTTRACYCVPCIFQTNGQPDLLIGANTGDGFYSINPQTGEINWSSKVIKQRSVASAFSADGLLFASSGSGGGGNELVAIRPPVDGKAEPTTAYVVSKSANYVPTAIAVNEHLFLFGDKGIATCVELQSGKVAFRERLSSGFSASPVASGDHIFITDQQGEVFVLKAEPKFSLLGKSSLGESSTATPAIAHGRIFFRTDSQLMALSGAKADE